MSGFLVTSDKEARLAERMVALGVREADLEETFVRSGGPGGQNVNKTASCYCIDRPSSRSSVRPPGSKD